MAQCRPGFVLTQSSAPATMKAGSNTKSTVATITPTTRSETTERPLRITGPHDQCAYVISDHMTRIPGSAGCGPNRRGLPRKQRDNRLLKTALKIAKRRRKAG